MGLRGSNQHGQLEWTCPRYSQDALRSDRSDQIQRWSGLHVTSFVFNGLPNWRSPHRTRKISAVGCANWHRLLGVDTSMQMQLVLFTCIYKTIMISRGKCKNTLALQPLCLSSTFLFSVGVLLTTAPVFVLPDTLTSRWEYETGLQNEGLGFFNVFQFF